MLRCPHCNAEICLQQLPYQGLFANFRICAHCAGGFTVDPETRRRQAVFLIVTLIATVITLLLYIRGTVWLIPALVIYVVWGMIFYRANKLMFLVTYQKNQEKSKNIRPTSQDEKPNE